MKDKQLTELFEQKNKQALYETKAKYGEACQSMISRMLRTKSEGKDCERDAYYALWSAEKYPAPNRLSVFFLRLTKEAAFKKTNGRSFARRDTLLTVCAAELNEVLPEGYLQQTPDSQQLTKTIKAFLRFRSKKQKMLFIRRYWYFDSIDELSTRFGMSPEGVKTDLERLRERLKKYLTKGELFDE